MFAGLSVPGGVTIGRVITTEGRPAFLAGAKVNPGRADLNALFAFETLRFQDGADGVDVPASLAFHISPPSLFQD
jgi:hypothetical protein